MPVFHNVLVSQCSDVIKNQKRLAAFLIGKCIKVVVEFGLQT